jgi:hypothetical protein
MGEWVLSPTGSVITADFGCHSDHNRPRSWFQRDRQDHAMASKHGSNSPAHAAAQGYGSRMRVILLWHVRHARNLDGSPTVHRDESGELTWDEWDGDDLKLLGVYSTEQRVKDRIERARLLADPER